MKVCCEFYTLNPFLHWQWDKDEVLGGQVTGGERKTPSGSLFWILLPLPWQRLCLLVSASPSSLDSLQDWEFDCTTAFNGLLK